MDAITRPRRTRISPVERAAKASAEAMRLAAGALVEYVPALSDDQARAAVMAVRAGMVPGVAWRVEV